MNMSHIPQHDELVPSLRKRVRGRVALGHPATCPLGRGSASLQPDPCKGVLPLSRDLREKTATLHDRAETLLGLPGGIMDKADYVDWLRHFLALYDPIERRIAGFEGWSRLASVAPDPGHSRRLLRDLDALGIDADRVLRAPSECCPPLTNFARALGARYVLEGSALGGRVILHHLKKRIGDEIGETTAFFGGPSHGTAPHWRAFQAALDRFGVAHPDERADVLAGAAATFTALIEWFAPFVAARRV
ncbi:biliverdin-producing heme oxygenase [Cereibacter johrii]|uniref:biliverdin-producing heme oxygenase n=1 Tax=Cereibacter johrii TaxID=445629 RepID=UPI002B262304|nr:biliverdin-producing heme oxygenase [Cereibacter johrii]MEA5163454.1 biliverdin-producing heme oxygenase [Cereibacter johrii]